jgi:hypothetical protein
MSAPTYPIYLNKEVLGVTATSGAWTLTLSNVDGIITGMRGSVGGFTTAAWNVPNVTITAVDQTLNTISYSHGNFTVAQQEIWAQFILRCSFIALENLEQYLGYEFTAGDDAEWAQCQVDAANDWAFRTRRSSGYQDHPNVCPGHDVGVGTVLYAGTLVKQRGAVDGFASFDNQGFGVAPGQSFAEILRLLGCKRPQVG